MAAQIPLTPPTDNLYKFLTVAGFLLAIVCIVLADNDVADAETKVWEAEYQSSRTDAVMGQLANSRTQMLLLDSILRGERAARLDTTSPFYREFLHLSDSVSRQVERSRRALMEAKSAISRLERRRAYLRLWTFVGFSTAVLGMITWYFRFQRFQDELLQLQVRAAGKGAKTGLQRQEEADIEGDGV